MNRYHLTKGNALYMALDYVKLVKLLQLIIHEFTIVHFSYKYLITAIKFSLTFFLCLKVSR